MALISINPATGETIREYKEMTQSEVEQVLVQSQAAFTDWCETDFTHRAELLRKVAAELRSDSDGYARLMTEEMGKPIREGRAETEKCAWVCDYYAEKAEEFLSPQLVETDASESYIAFQPMGVVLAVMPWNFPFWQVFRFAAPTLMAGNVGVLKHSSNVMGCALAIEEVFRRAGYPEGCFRTLLVGGAGVEPVIENPIVKAVTLTGSTPAGKAVASKAGDMLKKIVLELGGSDPYVILEDADLNQAVAACVTSRLINTGQSCIAAKRYIVVESLYEEFKRRLLDQMSKVKAGDPMLEETQIGPLAREDLRDELHDQVVRSIERGARCLLGGKIPEDAGTFYPVTILADVKSGMPAYEEEIFGPVATLIPVKNEEEAIRVANDSLFGLGAAVFTSDLAKGARIATTKLEAGCCFVNDFVRSDPRLPFGGVKESGCGRELSEYGIKEFVNIKTVYIK